MSLRQMPNDDRGQPLAANLIRFIEPSGHRAVQVKNAKKFIRCHQRHHQFGTRLAIAGDMAGVSAHIRNKHRSPLCRRSTADSLAERNAYAGRATLEWSKDQFAAVQKIESCPVQRSQCMDKSPRRRLPHSQRDPAHPPAGHQAPPPVLHTTRLYRPPAGPKSMAWVVQGRAWSSPGWRSSLIDPPSQSGNQSRTGISRSFSELPVLRSRRVGVPPQPVRP